MHETPLAAISPKRMQRALIIDALFGNMMDLKKFVGCCGTYCKTCKPYIEGQCKGCRLGYDTGERDINRAKCKIKVCCVKDREFKTCADCPDFTGCKTIHGLYDKDGYKYGKYRQSMEFIRENGYDKFIKHAEKWSGPYGKLV